MVVRRFSERLHNLIDTFFIKSGCMKLGGKSEQVAQDHVSTTTHILYVYMCMLVHGSGVYKCICENMAGNARQKCGGKVWDATR